jgi:hypothetical protein
VTTGAAIHNKLKSLIHFSKASIYSSRRRHVPKVLIGFFLSVIVFGAMAFASPRDASADSLGFEVVNEGYSNVYAIYASPVDIYVWGPNLIGRNVIVPGAYGFLEFDDGTSDCWYDLKVVTDRGDAFLYDIDLCIIELVRIF